MINRIGTRPVSATDVANHLKIEHEIIDDELLVYVNSLIDSAVAFCEKYTGRTLIDSNFHAHLDYFTLGQGYELRLSPLNSITSVQYYLSGSLQTIDSENYYTTSSERFKRLCPAYGYSWPQSNQRLQSVVVDCVAGYTSSVFPDDLKIALLHHVAAMYSDRGDCSDGKCNPCSLPTVSKNIYGAYRIKDLFVGV